MRVVCDVLGLQNFGFRLKFFSLCILFHGLFYSQGSPAITIQGKGIVVIGYPLQENKPKDSLVSQPFALHVQGNALVIVLDEEKKLLTSSEITVKKARERRSKIDIQKKSISKKGIKNTQKPSHFVKEEDSVFTFARNGFLFKAVNVVQPKKKSLAKVFLDFTYHFVLYHGNEIDKLSTGFLIGLLPSHISNVSFARPPPVNFL